ncbi:hypothetical protein M9H77_13053 [Catharanthus roseus]|uniref:Uncharacterized protein n=1 Tax=Catharanthus roseus TaxID=4058 RepID=A0ACC0BJA0_CATRO|nr:hypothetical protein M9H77_13053 [Catharanthus roseus]
MDLLCTPCYALAQMSCYVDIFPCCRLYLIKHKKTLTLERILAPYLHPGPLLMEWKVSDSGEWIHLKRDVAPWRVWPNRSTWTPHHALQGAGHLVDSQEELETKLILTNNMGRAIVMEIERSLCPWGPTIALHVLLYSGIEATLMCLDSLRLPSCAQTPHINSGLSEAHRYPTQPQLT